LNFALIPSGGSLHDAQEEYLAVLCLPSFQPGFTTGSPNDPGDNPSLPKDHENVDNVCISIAGAKEVACFEVTKANEIPPTGFRGEIAGVLGARGEHRVNVGFWAGDDMVGEVEFTVYSFGAREQTQGARIGDPMVFITNVPYGSVIFGEELAVDLVVANVGQGGGEGGRRSEGSELPDPTLYNKLIPTTRRFAPRHALRFSHRSCGPLAYQRGNVRGRGEGRGKAEGYHAGG